MSALTALVLSFAIGPYLIQRLTLQRIGQQVRDVGPESHQPKAGTPTMGGALILLAIAISTRALGEPDATGSSGSCSSGTLFFGVIGFVDDYKKLDRAQLEGPERARQALLADRRRAWRRDRVLHDGRESRRRARAADSVFEGA